MTTEFSGYDVLSYHLQLPKEWIAAGAIEGHEHNAYSYLPNLVEAAYAHLGVWRGSMVDAAVAAQLLHVAMAIIAACAIGRLVTDVTSDRSAGLISGAAYLAVPWTLVTGSMAYNEQAVMAFGAAAIAMAARTIVSADDKPTHWRVAILIGVLVGASILAKLGGGAMIGAAVFVVMAAKRHGAWKRWSARVVAFVGAAAAIVALWTTRNGLWTDNPVFPMFTAELGTGHWTDEQAARWTAAHTPGDQSALARLWSQGVAHFQYGYIVAPAALLATIARLAIRGRARRVAITLTVGALLMTGMWLALTHHQSRFLIPLLLPGVALIGLGVAALPRVPQIAAGVCLIAALTLQSAYLYHGWGEVPHATSAPYLIGYTGYYTDPPPEAPPVRLDQAINMLPDSAKVYTEGFATPFYVTRPIDYHTVWDTSPLAEAFESNGAASGIAWLKAQGYTHVGIDWVMLHVWTQPGNYGYDPRLPPHLLKAFADQHLTMVFAQQNPERPTQALYRIK